LHVVYRSYQPDAIAEGADRETFYDMATLAVTNGSTIVQCMFFQFGAQTAFPTGFPADWTFDASVAPVFAGWAPIVDEDTGEDFVYEDDLMEESFELVPGESVALGTVPLGSDTIVAFECEGSEETPVVRLYSYAGDFLAETAIPLSTDIGALADVRLGGGFLGEISEVRFWDGVVREGEELISKANFVSPLSEGLAFYLRPIANSAVATLLDEASQLPWSISGGGWTVANESGMNIAFEDEGLKRIDRSTVTELADLAAIVPAIQKKIDLIDVGLNPLGLAPGAIPFDLTPIGLADGTSSHYEQIRDRAKTALGNARAALERAQTSANHLRLLQEDQAAMDDVLAAMELETKNKLIEYFGYPYSDDIGAGGTYEQGYDGPDIYHYAWTDPTAFCLTDIEDTVAVSLETKKKPVWADGLGAASGSAVSIQDLTFERSASGVILKPSSIKGSRRADGKIQMAIGDYMCAYAAYKTSIRAYGFAVDDFEEAVTLNNTWAGFAWANLAIKEARNAYGLIAAFFKGHLKVMENVLGLGQDVAKVVTEVAEGSVPEIIGAGMTVNTDPSAVVKAALAGPEIAETATWASATLAVKNFAASIDVATATFDMAVSAVDIALSFFKERTAAYQTLRSAWYNVDAARRAVTAAYRELGGKKAVLESVIAEAERVIEERTLARKQASDSLTRARYNEMFFRLTRNAALTRYDESFDLAQKYVWLTAQAYDYETGLLSSDPQSGVAFLGDIIGARTLGEFGEDGEPAVTSGNGDGGLSDILARMDANWLVLKPRLGINNPQNYATWFSLRHELFRIYEDERGDSAWRTALEKCWVDDIKTLPEFIRYCQPLAGSDSLTPEPGLVIPFPTEITFGKNFFGEDLAGGDSSLDATWFSTHIAAAGIHFEGYNGRTNNYAGTLPLSKTPSAYLVPVGDDCMRAPGATDKVISWRVVDQTVPAPYVIGSTELDDPDWTPLYTGATGGTDLGANIRRHPSFRAYAGDLGVEPSDDELDATRLIGRSAWNTKWLLIIPAGSLGADRETALATFIRGADVNRDGKQDVTPVRDIRLGLKTYSRSGN